MRYLNPLPRLVLKPVFQSWLKKYKTILETQAEQAAPQRTAVAQPRA